MLRKLVTDPRVIGSAVACSCIYIDDLPGQPYGTFRDPGGAALLSIIFAQFTVLAFIRNWNGITPLTWALSLLAKLGLQPLFYVQNALPIDLMFLIGAHCVIGCLVRHHLQIATFDAMLIATLVSCMCALLVSWAVHLCAGPFDYSAYFWSFASARVTFPYFFWTFIFFARGKVPNGFEDRIENTQ